MITRNDDRTVAGRKLHEWCLMEIWLNKGVAENHVHVYEDEAGLIDACRQFRLHVHDSVATVGVSAIVPDTGGILASIVLGPDSMTLVGCMMCPVEDVAAAIQQHSSSSPTYYFHGPKGKGHDNATTKTR